jgi:hypothetical protein
MVAAAAAAAAIAQAISASGVLVRLEPEEFQRLLQKIEQPLIVTASGGVFSTKYQYLVSYRGLAFHTKSKSPIPLPVGAETVSSNKLWMPQ